MQNHEYPLIFIVEDNTIYNKFIASQLRIHKFTRIESYLSGEECLENLYKKPDIIIQDYLLNGITGIDVLKIAKQDFPHAEFIFLSGQDNINIAVKSMKHGAFDYVVKDLFAVKKVTDCIDKIMEIQKGILQTENNKKPSIFSFSK
ncbi:MAG TPA: response regulator [Prolixibacteraceae bacterium]|jgi:DNA-binding NtrC family response regulator